MIEQTLIGLLVLLVLVPVGVAAFFISLRLMDRILGIDFTQEIRNFTLPKALYFGARAIAVALLISALFSRFV